MPPPPKVAVGSLRPPPDRFRDNEIEQFKQWYSWKNRGTPFDRDEYLRELDIFLSSGYYYGPYARDLAHNWPSKGDPPYEPWRQHTANYWQDIDRHSSHLSLPPKRFKSLHYYKWK